MTPARPRPGPAPPHKLAGSPKTCPQEASMQTALPARRLLTPAPAPLEAKMECLLCA